MPLNHHLVVPPQYIYQILNETMSSKYLYKLVFKIISILSIVVFVAVVVLNRKILPRPEVMPSWVMYLPTLNAIINGTCSILLLLSLYFIKQKNIAVHKTLNLTAFVLSACFLISYILYHWMANETSFPEGNSMRTLYLTILVSHIILAALVLPLILLAFYYGLQMNVEKHKKIVRFAYPIWLYVTITGVVVYLMISPYYQF
jgi:putative membrane protein